MEARGTESVKAARMEGMATISEAIAIALGHHQAGNLAAAEEIYRQILVVDPNCADALHLVGVIAHQRGQHEVAIGSIRRAIELNGREAGYYNNLGAAYRSVGKLE